MKYTVTVETYGEVSVEPGTEGVTLTIHNDQDPGDNEGPIYAHLSKEEFKEFRRAVGYAGQELEGGVKR